MLKIKTILSVLLLLFSFNTFANDDLVEEDLIIKTQSAAGDKKVEVIK